MNIYGEAYNRGIAENQQQAAFWEGYVKNLRELDLNVFADKLKVSALIPIGSRILFRGDLVHTNEIMVALGANYFVKCSAKQAEVLKQHRIKDAQEKLNVLRKERDYLENQLLFSNLLQETGQEIIEPYTEDEEIAWRLKHRDNVRKFKEENKQDNEHSNVSDEEFWRRLEELELKEELDNDDSSDKDHITSFQDISGLPESCITENIYAISKITENEHKVQISNELTTDERIKMLKSRLFKIKSTEKVQTQTESDVFKRLEQLEEQEAIQEELDRLEGNIESDVEDVPPISNSTKKSISFASENEDSCIEINFKHSKVNPDFKPHDKSASIMKPSDIYEAYPENFQDSKPTVSILKKSQNYRPQIADPKGLMPSEEAPRVQFNQRKHVNVMGDVIENKVDLSSNEMSKISITESRPVSKFKAMRVQKSLQ